MLVAAKIVCFCDKSYVLVRKTLYTATPDLRVAVSVSVLVYPCVFGSRVPATRLIVETPSEEYGSLQREKVCIQWVEFQKVG